MSSYNLLPNEVVLLNEERVFHGKRSSGELTLTNLNLIFAKKGAFGGSKGFQIFPVSQIKVYNGQAHALMSGSNNELEVYFLHSEEEFRFTSGGKKKIQTWIAKINEAVTGEPAAEVGGFAAQGAEKVAGLLKDTFGAFKSKPEAPVSVQTKCSLCGAPVSGVAGQTITCTYCDAAQQL